jgi:hypothetical protein
MTPSKLIYVQTTPEYYEPLSVVDRLNLNTPIQTLETPGQRFKCKFEEEDCEYCNCQTKLTKFNNLMVLVERHWSVEDQQIIASFWDLRDEPRLFKEEDLMDKLTSDILDKGALKDIDQVFIDISSEIMAVHFQTTTPDNSSTLNITLFYRVNTTEPSKEADFIQLVKIVENLEPSDSTYSRIGLNEKYFVRRLEDFFEVSEIDALLKAVEKPKIKILKEGPQYFNIEPGISNRLAIFDYQTRILKIVDLETGKPIIEMNTIHWMKEDQSCDINHIEGSWCCGHYLFFQKVKLQNKKNGRDWEFALSIVNFGTQKNQAVEVTNVVQDIWDSSIYCPEIWEFPEVLIDLSGLVLVVQQAEEIYIHCAQFAKTASINALQGRCCKASEGSSNFDSGLLLAINIF